MRGSEEKYTPDVLDSAQLVRIEAVHRGFLYQHLYAVGCLLLAQKASVEAVTVELDEDIELNSGQERIYVQVKTRLKPIILSDVSGALARFRLLTVIDLYTRECLGICVGQNLRSSEVAEMLDTIALRRPLPQLLKTDNGSEFAGKMLDKWVYERDIRIDFSRPGTPTDNATVESFNGRLRQECLNENWFMSKEDARCKIEVWRIHYNQSRPHSALGWMTPCEFAEKSAGCQNKQPT